MKRITTTVTTYEACGQEWLPVSKTVTEVVEADSTSAQTVTSQPYHPWTYPRATWTING